MRFVRSQNTYIVQLHSATIDSEYKFKVYKQLMLESRLNDTRLCHLSVCVCHIIFFLFFKFEDYWNPKMQFRDTVLNHGACSFTGFIIVYSSWDNERRPLHIDYLSKCPLLATRWGFCRHSLFAPPPKKNQSWQWAFTELLYAIQDCTVCSMCKGIAYIIWLVWFEHQWFS